MKTHYDTLEIARTASAEVVKGAYKYLCQKWHPDKHPRNRIAAEARLSEINVAYGVLSDGARRAAYDRSLEASERTIRKPPPEPPAPPPPPPSARDNGRATAGAIPKRPWRRYMVAAAVLCAIALLVGNSTLPDWIYARSVAAYGMDEYLGVRLGMSKDEVRYLLGLPDGAKVSGAETIWSYGTPESRAHKVVRFDGNWVELVLCLDEVGKLCPPLAGIETGDAEEVIVRKFGQSAESRLFDDGTKVVSYGPHSAQLSLSLNRKHVSSISVSRHE